MLVEVRRGVWLDPVGVRGVFAEYQHEHATPRPMVRVSYVETIGGGTNAALIGLDYQEDPYEVAGQIATRLFADARALSDEIRDIRDELRSDAWQTGAPVVAVEAPLPVRYPPPPPA